MKSVSMSGSLRENVGKKDAKRLRTEGKVPCVIYGGKEQIKFAVEDKQFKKLLFTPEVQLVKMNIDGKEYDAYVQDVQYHPVTDIVYHVDFMEITPSKPIIIGVPLEFVGNSPGVMKGGKLFKKMRKLTVKALASDLPDFINVDISVLDIDQTVKVGDISIPKIEILDLPSSIIAGVRVTRAVVEGPATEATPPAAK